MGSGIRRSVLNGLFIFIFTVVLTGQCLAQETEGVPSSVEACPVIHEMEFGGAYIEMTIDEFNALGYAYGDSLDVVFSNGYELTDLPYYNGFYTQPGEPLMIAYPGYPYIKACINSGDDLWEVAGLEEGMSASITLNTAGKYLDIQKARDIYYKDDRELYESDEVFANFRSMSGGKLKEDTIYRSASPCDNQHNRAPYVDALMKDAGVQFILNLSDTEEKIQGYMKEETFDSPYFAELYEDGRVVAIGLNMNYGSQEFKEKVAAGLTQMSQQEGPYLIHCTEGKDRTGFVCMLIEALAGADYEEIEKDYMTTYYDYYGIDKETDPDRYDVIVENMLHPMIRSMAGDESIDVKTVELDGYAEDFLKQAGMDDDAITRLKDKIFQGRESVDS